MEVHGAESEDCRSLSRKNEEKVVQCSDDSILFFSIDHGFGRFNSFFWRIVFFFYDYFACVRNAVLR